MARLIDADALQQHFTDMQRYERCACNFTDDGGEPATEWYCVEDVLENAPTIDAIPVEWIENMLKEWLKSSASFETCGAISAMLVRWQKEQEAR